MFFKTLIDFDVFSSVIRTFVGFPHNEKEKNGTEQKKSKLKIQFDVLLDVYIFGLCTILYRYEFIKWI